MLCMGFKCVLKKKIKEKICDSYPYLDRKWWLYSTFFPTTELQLLVENTYNLRLNISVIIHLTSSRREYIFFLVPRAGLFSVKIHTNFYPLKIFCHE